jgi:hypothetical protein
MSPSSLAIESVSAPGSRLSTLPEGYPRFTLGEEAAKWAHTWLTQPNGPRAGKPFKLTLDQYRFLLHWYALDEEGNWLYHHGVRRLAKGSGKSPFAAVLALLEFLGPVRLDRFDDRLPGGCKGKPVDMPLVQIAATAESQTANTMRMVRAFAPKKSKLVEAYGLDPGKTQYYKLPEGTLEIITSSVTASEGAESTFVVADETEHWKPSNSGPELASTLEDNLAKSGARMLETSNAWVPGIESVAESTWDAWVLQEEGKLREEGGLVLYDARLAPPDTDLADPDSLRSALEWIYGDCDWKRPRPDAAPDVRPIMKRIWSPKAKPSESKRKYLNWPTTAEDAWTAPEDWAVLTDVTRLVEDGEEIALFFDGSKSRDTTALIGCCIEDGHVFTVGVWEPDSAHDTQSVVPVADVDLAVRRAAERWKVLGFFGDVQEWESFVKVAWPQLFPDLIVQAIGGKDPQQIAWDMRGHVYEFTLAAELTLDEIESGSFTHDGDSRLARHVTNMRRRPNQWGVSVGKESKDSPKKIDAGVCVIGARLVRRQVLAEKAKQPEPKKKPGRVRMWG